MRTEADRWLGALFHGWVELVTLFALLLAALALIGWCWNRGFRPADRGPLVAWPMLVAGFGMLLLLRHAEGGSHFAIAGYGDGAIWSAAIIGGGVLVAGLLARIARPAGLWVPAMLLAALLGQGLHLSALALTVLTALVLLFSSGRTR